MTVDDPRYTLVPIPQYKATESSGSSAGLPLPPAPEPEP
ncbi:glycosyltransferase [Cutibacterium acnes JCM 18918]|nr:glycosyltransferase [Cutibacterium acnes JCM 18918]